MGAGGVGVSLLCSLWLLAADSAAGFELVALALLSLSLSQAQGEGSSGPGTSFIETRVSEFWRADSLPYYPFRWLAHTLGLRTLCHVSSIALIILPP